MTTEVDRIFQKFQEKRQNKFVILRPFSANDKPEMAKIFYDDVLHHMELVLGENEDKLSAYVSHLIKQQELGKAATFSCFSAHDDSFAGITQLKYIDFFNLKLEMGGTWYGKNYQGTGLNMACKQILFHFVFDDLNFKRLQFSIDQDNIASIKSMEKIGAEREGLFRNNWVDSSGKSRNDIYYSVTDADWSILKQNLYKDFY